LLAIIDDIILRRGRAAPGLHVDKTWLMDLNWSLRDALLTAPNCDIKCKVSSLLKEFLRECLLTYGGDDVPVEFEGGGSPANPVLTAPSISASSASAPMPLQDAAAAAEATPPPPPPVSKNFDHDKMRNDLPAAFLTPPAKKGKRRCRAD